MGPTSITFSASLPSEMVAPRIQMEHEINVAIQDGDTVTFVCKVEGNPEPRLLFFKDDKRLRSNENISIGKKKKWKIIEKKKCLVNFCTKLCSGKVIAFQSFQEHFEKSTNNHDDLPFFLLFRM